MQLPACAGYSSPPTWMMRRCAPAG
jgi:hypothetical protein